ncbi:MAG: Caudovirus prohead serine protease [Bryobacterales bacterium]|jgi:hypothetical protein|nr:Caudovirus prohead serine protease [Bryobacterales bacterium]
MLKLSRYLSNTDHDRYLPRLGPGAGDRIQVYNSLTPSSGVIRRSAAQFGHTPAVQTAKASPRFLVRSLHADNSAIGPSKTTISGCAVPYEKTSTAVGSLPEVFKAGCFRKSLLLHPDTTVMHNFRTDMIIGRTQSLTAQVWEDDSGLRFEAIRRPAHLGPMICSSVSTAATSAVPA